MMKVISAQNLNFSYTNPSILKDISFDIHQGEYVAIIGDNGSGKSTLLKLLLNIEKADSGNILLFDEPIGKFQSWHRIGYVPQTIPGNDTQFPITVREVIYSGIMTRQTVTEEERITEKAGLLEIRELLELLMSELSVGQRQRVLVARALINNPEILILDEPSSSTDQGASTNLHDLLGSLNKDNNVTIIEITHDQDTISGKVDRVLCLERNELCAQRTDREHVHNKV